MAEFNLERFKYNWKGTWAASTQYDRDDIVLHGPSSYVCLIGHTSDASLFDTDLNATVPGSDPPVAQPRWRVMTDSQAWRGRWTTSYTYAPGDIVLFDGSLWVCTTGHLAAAFEDNVDDWTLFVDGIEYQTEWANGVNYGPGALAQYNGIIYKCITAHTSTALLEDNISDWEVFVDGVFFNGSWLPDTVYRKNDLVKYGGTLWRCTYSHTSGLQFGDGYFEVEFPGYQFDGEYDEGTYYQTGDIVTYGGDLFYCVTNAYQITPTDDNPFYGDGSSVYWIKMLRSYNLVGDYDADRLYKPGEVVRRGGELYVAVDDVPATLADGSTDDYLDTTLWEKLVEGKNWANNWRVDTVYYVGDVVYFLGNAYVCNNQHKAANENFPGDNGSGYDYWDLVIQAGLEAGMDQKGDLLTYNNNRTIKGDESTQGPTSVRIVNQDELLTVTDENDIFWKDFYNEARTVYVDVATGTDAPGRGIEPTKPFKTIKYASHYVEDNITGNAKIAVATGRYEEVCPIIVPANCVIMGDELRATVIVANPKKDAYQNDTTYTYAWLDRLANIMFQLLVNEDVNVSPGNTEPQVKTGLNSNTSVVDIFSARVADFKNYVDFRVNDGETDPTLSGSNVENTSLFNQRAVSILSQNLAFLKAEANAYLEFTYPDITFDNHKINMDVEETVRGIKHDIKYSGNYGTIQSARHYSNSATGSQEDDMFYVRDTTGVRQCTVTGLEGILNPPGVFALYQKPTGGAFVSLDPGWGPADERTWIMNRSPYIQGVTTIGTNCIGQKIDGALHNGGNKSCTSNDFTQVLSDGIGAWITNKGRAELVSVFTYYCAIGYLAERGGIIRSTNGNNSYGRYGSIADGIDPDETPQDGTINNRFENDPVVSAAFAGEVTDKILALEFSHCGEEFTNATATITGSGANAATIFEDFRDGGLFQARLAAPPDSGSAGGSGYLLAENNAQTGDTTTITIAQSDDNDPEDYLGMRIFIVSGTGTGQYGYISNYVKATRVVTVRKESTGELGWDHIVPGTTIVSALQTNTRYRIEPRLTVSDPGFNVDLITLPNSALEPKDYQDIAWGTTTNRYNVVAPFGSAVLPGIDESPAQFAITKSGETYTATLTAGGASYAVNDELTILGTALGGDTPANDATITVTSVTDDSTQSVNGFTISGTGKTGKWVAIAPNNYAIYTTDDDETWEDTTLPTGGNWKHLVAFKNRFVAFKEELTDEIAYSETGETWSTYTLPVSGFWKALATGNDKFVAISEVGNDVVYSANGRTWSGASVPDNTDEDSTSDQWQGLAFGMGKFVAVSGSSRTVAMSEDGDTWTRYDDALPDTPADIVDVAFGNGRFVVLLKNQNTIFWSEDGENWNTATAPSPDDSTVFEWQRLRYANGLFFAVGETGGKDIGADQTDGTTRYAATSTDGIKWDDRDLEFPRMWYSVGYGKQDGVPCWYVIAKNDNDAVKIKTGRPAFVRAKISSGKFDEVRIIDPGSGYTADDPPVLSVVDNNYTLELFTDMRYGNGVIGQPSFTNRGIGYRTSSTNVTLKGDGFADIIPEANEIVIDGLDFIPGPGAQILITGILNEDTEEIEDDLKIFTLTIPVDKGSDGNGGKRLAATITPKLEVSDNLAHATTVQVRSNYSQCRVSGHDFLDIGTGNFIDTNYPEIYSSGNYFVAQPENEVYEVDGGRVFYTSTDQNGNFRAGELFSVEQATGIVTISAEFFDLDGLSELALGGVRLGGSGTVVREFSTDVTFQEDSNNVVPTQRAIATFLANRLSEGGSELETNTLIAGQVRLGTAQNVIEHTAEGTVRFPRRMNFDSDETNIQGMLWAQRYFMGKF